ncbi:hypothetical protein EVJ58_g6219 [Rhodofomes roseus]|uniref:Uncharacterized protein n=1 Tax=Rhodofomes roseus TaxID=34475 RepID=A0A4Y9Y8B3_9APHY|nr:hypothetical protein EVJ58_g6219 [Rhodofomes roseus]
MKDYVRAWAHVEYGRGFLVFDRISGQKEIWRLADDIDNSSVSASPPDTSQLEAFSVTSRRHGRSGRGRLRPWALLTMPEMTRACRFVYPTFLAASQNTAYLWDLPSARLVQTLHGFQAMHNDIEPLGDVRYVDVDARHVVLCGQNGIRVISREDSSVVLRLSNTGSSTMLMSPELTQGSDRIPLVSPLKTEHMRSRDGHPWGRFRAVYTVPLACLAHLSETGRDLACLLADGRLVLIRDFERAVSGNVPIADAALEVDLTHVRRSNQNTHSLVARRNTRAGYYLAFEQGRVAVATSSGLYVVTLDASQRGLSIHGASAEDKSTVLQPPQSEDGISENTEIAVSWLPRISDAEVLQHISCLQLSATRLYITWQANRVDVIPNRHCNVTAQVWKDDPPYYEPDVKNVWTGRPMVHPRGPLRGAYWDSGRAQLI